MKEEDSMDARERGALPAWVVIVAALVAAFAAVRLAAVAGAQEPSAPVGAKQTVSVLANGMLLVTIPDPPKGTTYQGDYALQVPDGVQWCVRSITANLTTDGVNNTRRAKLAVRDPSDSGNQGRLFTIMGEGIGAWVYKDFSMTIGQNAVPGLRGPGTIGGVIRSPATAALPDICIPAPYQWAVINEGESSGDQWSLFYAIIEERPL